MKKSLFLSLLGLPVLFLWGCSFINNNDNWIHTWYIEKISQLEQQLSGLLEQFSWLQAENESLKETLSWAVSSLKTLQEENQILKSNQENTKTTSQNDIKKTSTTTKSNSITYYASRAWFWLKFPSERSWYVELSDQWGVDFSLNDRQMFYIHVQTTNEYNQYWEHSGQQGFTYLGQNQNYRFYYKIFPIWYKNNDNPSSWMMDRINEIPSIIQTFYIQ
jgi:regulator of replication initiation timing